VAGNEAMSGKLYGLGVGPGDPELLTLKAWRILSTVPVVAYLAADGKPSTAREIVKPFLQPEAQELQIVVPMRPEREPAQKAYDEGATAIRAHLDQGRDVALLCEGDPFFYGSFSFLHARLGADYETIVVPGVTSLSGASAAIGQPLTVRDQILKVLPATLDTKRLREELRQAGSIAIIKAGRHFGKVRTILSDLDLLTRATVIVHATREDERILAARDVEGDTLPYFSTILLRTPETVP
jgi:precorrin-2/cobalt-factor-2 C20-methyltransferase